MVNPEDACCWPVHGSSGLVAMRTRVLGCMLHIVGSQGPNAHALVPTQQKVVLP